MAPRLAALCEPLVRARYGDNASHVFKTLACHGRLAFFQLQAHTGIAARYLKPIVCVLVHHDLLLWHQADENEPVYYQVDWYTAHVLLRQGKIARLVEQRHGKTAHHLLQSILVEGKVEVGELEDRQYFEMGSPRDSGVDLMDEDQPHESSRHDCKAVDDKPMTVDAFHNTLRALLEDGFLAKVTSRDHVPVAELQEQLRMEIISSDPRTYKDGKTTGPKTAAAFASAANSLKRKWQTEAEYSSQRDVGTHGTIKRSNKRRKGNTGFDLHDADNEDVDMTAHGSSVDKLPSDLCLRVNYNKCMTALRSQRLEALAGNYLGAMSAAVYGALLRAAEGKTHLVRSQLRAKTGFSLDDEGEAKDNADITIADTELVDLMDKTLDLMSTIKVASSTTTNGTSNGKKRRMVPDGDEDIAALGIKEEVESDDEDVDPIVNGIESAGRRQKRLNHIGIHLDLIGESPKNFLRRNGQRRTSTINFGMLCEMLTRVEVDRMILARSGEVGLRVCRILRDKGKLQDTQIAGFCLKRLKDLRAMLTNLQNLGFIDVQEMPKDNYRQPSRTTYLWSLNEHQVRQDFLQQTYQGLVRSMERLDLEQEYSKDIIEKAESVDWDMKKLNKPEQELLGRWHTVEATMATTIERLDDVIMILRDFNEADTSLQT